MRFSLHLLIFANEVDLSKLDGAIRNRAIVCPLDAHFNTGKPMKMKSEPRKTYAADMKIVEKMTTPEALNILFTMLTLGARRYYENNMQIETPDIVLEATNDLLDLAFPYTDFINECCVEGAVDKFKCKSSDMYNAYVVYTSCKAHTDKLFIENMSKRYVRKKISTYFYKGIALKSQTNIINPTDIPQKVDPRIIHSMSSALVDNQIPMPTFETIKLI